MKVLCITNSDRYEVSDKGRVWKSGPKRRGPIPELRIPVHGFSWGAGYRAFLKVATPRWAASSFGVFIKLQEVGADADIEDRWLIVPRTGGVTENSTNRYFAGIAEETGFSVKDIEKAVEVLTHKEVAWLEWVEVDDDSRTIREFPEHPALCATCYGLLCTDLLNKENTVKDKTDELNGIKIPPHMDTLAVRQAVKDWLTHHIEIGKPYKSPSKSMALLFKQHPTAEGFVADVEHSIANNYQGLIHAKENHGKTGNMPTGPGHRHPDDVKPVGEF